MPRGIPNKKPAVEIVIEDTHQQRTGMRGRLDRMCAEMTFNAEAIKRTLLLLDADDRRIAQATLPQKLLLAATHDHQRRALNGNGNGHHAAVTVKKKQKRSGKWSLPIRGKRLALFLLEHLDESEHRQLTSIRTQLEELMPGTTVPGRVLNGVCGALMNHGQIKRTADGYKRTAAGTRHQNDLRQRLEQDGKIDDKYRDPRFASS